MWCGVDDSIFPFSPPPPGFWLCIQRDKSDSQLGPEVTNYSDGQEAKEQGSIGGVVPRCPYSMPLPLFPLSGLSRQYWTPLVIVGDSQHSLRMGDHADHLVRGTAVREWLLGGGGGEEYWCCCLWRGDGMALTPEGRDHSCGSDSFQFSSVQSLSHVQLFAAPWIAEPQASLSITNSKSLLKLTSIGSVMPSNRIIFCPPLLLLPLIFPSIFFQWVFSQGLFQWSVLWIRWPKYLSFSFSISPSSEYSGLISFRMDWLADSRTQARLVIGGNGESYSVLGSSYFFCWLHLVLLHLNCGRHCFIPYGIQMYMAKGNFFSSGDFGWVGKWLQPPVGYLHAFFSTACSCVGCPGSWEKSS